MTERPSPLEKRLGAALVGLRPADGAPAGLRARVQELPFEVAPSSVFGGLARWVVPSSIGALVIAGLIVMRGGLSAPPAATPGAPGIGIDPTVEGPGVVTSMIATLPIIGWAISAVLALIGVRIVRRGWRRARRLVVAGAVWVAAIGAAGLAVHPGPGVGGWNGYGPMIGFGPPVDAGSPGSDGAELRMLVVSARPGEPFAFYFVIHNPGPLAVRLEGIREDPEASTRVAPRWTALALGSNPEQFVRSIADLVTFKPVDIPPEEDLRLYVVGKASACAVGPGPYGTDQAFAVRGPQVEFVYSVLGLTNTSTYTLPQVIAEPIVFGCTG